jgi:large subunit ribosomal protein L34e
MPRLSRRSRSLRRVHKKMPGGSTKLVYDKRKPGVARCALCRIELKGISRLRPFQSRNAPKSKKRTQRIYGGFLCATCLKEKLKQEARAASQ